MKSLSLSKPHAIITTGIPGSGKTFFADKFADTFNVPCVSYDKIIHLASDEKAAYTLLFYQVAALLKTNTSFIIDGASNTRTERVELTKVIRAAGYETLLIWVQTDPATAKMRVIKESKGKAGQPISSAEHGQLHNRFSAPTAGEKPVVISGKHTYATQAKVILKKLSAPRAEISTHVVPPSRPEDRGGRRTITIR
jgi:predicted kinase